MPNGQVGPNSYTFVENRIVQNWSSSTKYRKSQSWIFFKGVWWFSPLPSLSRKVAYMFYCVQSKNMKNNRLLLISVLYWFLFFIIQNRSWKSNCFINILLIRSWKRETPCCSHHVSGEDRSLSLIKSRCFLKYLEEDLYWGFVLYLQLLLPLLVHTSVQVLSFWPRLTCSDLVLSCSSVCQQQVKLQADWRRPQGEFTIKADICLFYSRFIFTHIYIQHVDHRIIE